MKEYKGDEFKILAPNKSGYIIEMDYEDALILLDELGANTERTCHSIDPVDNSEFFICSECNFGAGRIEFIPKYCPNCGAKVVSK